MKRMPGTIEFYVRGEWRSNTKVSYVSDSSLCSKPGCMRIVTRKKSQRIQLKGSKRYCSPMCAVKHRFKLVAWLNPKHDTANDLQELVQSHNFCGLKLHPVFDQYPLTDPAVKPFIEKAIKLDVPTLIHTGWGPEGRLDDIGKLVEEFSDGTFVCLHMKEEFGLNDRFSHVELAAHNQNVYLECSYVPHPRRLAEVVDIIGPERILFGSDYPWGARDISWEKTKVTNADISVEAMKQILSVNARELLKL